MKHDGVDAEIPFDYGFVCLGMRPERPLMEELAAYGKEKQIEIVNIGDSRNKKNLGRRSRRKKYFNYIRKNWLFVIRTGKADSALPHSLFI